MSRVALPHPGGAVGRGLALTACSSSSATSSTSTAPPTTAAAVDHARPPSGPPTTIPTPPTSRRRARPAPAPTISVPSGSPPTQLETADLITGTGPAAKAGDSVTVQYVLATYSSGKEIQSSWTSQPFTFTLGAGQVIPGWDTGRGRACRSVDAGS